MNSFLNQARELNDAAEATLKQNDKIIKTLKFNLQQAEEDGVLIIELANELKEKEGANILEIDTQLAIDTVKVNHNIDAITQSIQDLDPHFFTNAKERLSGFINTGIYHAVEGAEKSGEIIGEGIRPLIQMAAALKDAFKASVSKGYNKPNQKSVSRLDMLRQAAKWRNVE